MKTAMLDDRQTIDQIIVRREALASIEAAEAADLLDYVDRARAVGEQHSQAQGRRRVDAAMHELSLALRLPVPTVERQVARARRLRSTMPTVWQAWHDGRLSTRAVEATASATRHQLANADRNITLRPAGDGMTRITALIGSADAAAILQRLTATAHALPAADTRTIDQARTDLFTGLLLERVGGGLGYQAIIGITVPLSSLMGFSDAPGELTDRSATIPAHIIRAAMADETSLLYRLVTDDIGNLLTVTWLGRFAPTRLK